MNIEYWDCPFFGIFWFCQIILTGDYYKISKLLIIKSYIYIISTWLLEYIGV